jgi:RNA polymerase sigma factor (sigma-70 family)
MMPMDDTALLQEYARTGAEAAFATLVQRHAGLVYSAARRQVRDPQLAEDVAQAVFIVLARKAGQVARHPGLSGWLLQTTRYAASAHIRAAARRARREQEAAMQTELRDSSPAIWTRLEPHLDEAMESLGATDRAVLAMRYFENQSAAEIGAALKLSEEAAKKRANRALEKLRKVLARRGVSLTTALIAVAVSANAVQAAPLGLVNAISTASITGGAAASAATLTMAKGALQTLAWSQYKALAASGIAALVVGTAAIVTISQKPPAPPPQTLARTNAVPTAREYLADGMLFSLDSFPGALALQPDGKLIVGSTLFGWFVDTNTGSLGYWSRGALRLNRDGSLDRTFLFDVGRHDSAADMAHVSTAADGRLLVSGLFDAVEGTPRPGYAMLNGDGSLDRTFQPWRGSNSVPGRTYLPGGTFPAVLLADGSVSIISPSVEGRHTSYGLTAYRLDATGAWMPPVSPTVAETFARPSGLIATLTGNGFATRRVIAWTNSEPAKPRPPVRYGYDIVAVADSPAVQDNPFDQWTESPTASEAAVVLKALFEEVPLEMCRYALRLPDGGFLLAVRDGQPHDPGRLMRFDSKWRPDFSFTNEFQAHPASRLTLRRQSDGKILVAGIVGRMNGEEFSGIMRLEPDGRIDHSFHCGIENQIGARVMDMALQQDGSVVICGFFSTVNGVEVPHIARLNPDGSLDQTFKPRFTSLEQFNRSRFGNPSRVPVASLAKPLPEEAVIANLPETIVITSLRLESGTAIVQFGGRPNRTYILQAKDSLNQPGWTNISTNQTAASGAGTLLDPDAGQHSARFYRVASP